MEPVKPSSPGTTLSIRPSLLQGSCWRENEAAQDDSWAGHHWKPRLHPESKDSILT
jgi:hypothetical protein